MLFAQELDLLLQAEVIIDIIEQPKVCLGIPENIYRPDFHITPCDLQTYYVDVKGHETQAFKKNKKLWSIYGKRPLHIVKRRGRKFVTTEIIEPKTS